MGLVTKHNERDLNIPKQREKLLYAIEKDLLNDDQVIAVFYGGSLGNNNTDLYSDIDLRIVVKDEVFEEYRMNKKQRAEKWGKVLFFEDFPWTTYSIAHYYTFIKVDTFYYQINDIQPSVWLQNIKIVKDTSGLLEDVLKKSMNLSYVPNVQDLEIWRTKFFAYVHEAYRRVMRKEIYYALQCLDHIRFSMVVGWNMEAGNQPNTFGDWAKIEGSRSKLFDWQLEFLEQWHSSREPNDIMNIINSIIPEFKNVNKNLCDRLKIEENPEWVEDIFNMVL